MMKVGRADAGRRGDERIGRDRARQRLIQREAEWSLSRTGAGLRQRTFAAIRRRGQSHGLHHPRQREIKKAVLRDACFLRRRSRQWV